MKKKDGIYKDLFLKAWILFVFCISISPKIYATDGMKKEDVEGMNKRIQEVLMSEREDVNFVHEDNKHLIKRELIRDQEKKTKEKKAEREEVTLESLKEEIHELKEILKENFESEVDLDGYVEAEDFLDFQEKEQRDEKNKKDNYIAYIYKYTEDYELAREINKNLLLYSKMYDVSPEIILSIMKAESRFNPTVSSPKGAYGLMQLMESTADFLEVNRRSVSENIKGGTKLIRKLLNETNENLPLTLASYNAGLEVVKKYNAIPPFPETENYVKKVLQGIGEIKDSRGLEDFNDSIDFQENNL